MAIKEVLRHSGGDDRLIFLERVGVPFTHLGSHLKAHMQQLPEVRVVARVRLIVPKRGRVLVASPIGDIAGRRQIGFVDVDDTGVRSKRRAEVNSICLA